MQCIFRAKTIGKKTDLRKVLIVRPRNQHKLYQVLSKLPISKISAIIPKTTPTKMHLIDADKEMDETELRTRIKDAHFIEQLRSQLIPGIENSENRFKIHQFTRAAMILPNFNEFQRLEPLIDGLVADGLDTKDFLGCAAALEILAEIASSGRRNIEYFEQIGLLTKIYELFKYTKSNPDLGHPYIACIRFFGYLSTADPNSLTKFPLFTADVFDAVNRFDAFDPVRRKLAFETFAIITTTSGAKQFLSSQQCPHNMAKAMNHLGAAVATGGGMPELKASYLDAIYTIFNSFDPKNAQLESSTILQNWFNELGGPFPQLLFQCLKMPFDAVQIAALHVLLALTKHEWGPAKFLQIDGFIDYILNRERPFSVVGLQLKHDFVCKLVESSSKQIDAETMEKLREYAALGPYAPPEKVDVATEEIQ